MSSSEDVNLMRIGAGANLAMSQRRIPSCRMMTLSKRGRGQYRKIVVQLVSQKGL